jgi:NADH-quinone oxidoreductase subunit F
MTDVLTPVLTDTWDKPRAWTLATYRLSGGYQGLRAALDMEPDQVIALVKDSGLRGRGGAGFPTGMKWGFIPQDGEAAAKPHYLVVNADESEPGTCKDTPLMMASPHMMIEGAIISAYAIRASVAFIYIRGEVPACGPPAPGSGAGCLRSRLPRQEHPRVRLRPRHGGARRRRCRTSAVRRRPCSTRWKACAASPGCARRSPPSRACTPRPTVINNVESIASVPSILSNGGAT